MAATVAKFIRVNCWFFILCWLFVYSKVLCLGHRVPIIIIMFQRTRGPVGFGFSWLKPPFDPPKEPEYRIKTLIECILCNDSVYYLKRLPCGHSMCESCIDKLIKCQRIECPFDTKGCTVKDGKAKNLPTKFAVSFACDDCSEDKHIDDMFFCKDCDANSCGYVFTLQQIIFCYSI